MTHPPTGHQITSKWKYLGRQRQQIILQRYMTRLAMRKFKYLYICGPAAYAVIEHWGENREADTGLGRQDNSISLAAANATPDQLGWKLSLPVSTKYHACERT